MPPLLGYAALNTVTVLWGTQHSIIKMLVVSVASNPVLVNSLRFSIAALFTGLMRALVSRVCPSAPPRAGAPPMPQKGACGLLIGAAELAVWQFIGFTLQLIGLQYTSASRSAFLLYLNATFVPPIAMCLGERDIGLRTWVCCFVAVAGTTLLANDGAPPNIGDLWSLGAALASAMYIVRLGHASKGRDAAKLSSATLLFTSILCWLLAIAAAGWSAAALGEQVQRFLREHYAALLYLSIVVSGGSSYLQAVGQQHVKAHEAAVIYTLDPVWGALFAFLLLGEQLHALGWVGITLVLVANTLRRLPWAAWAATRPLITPAPSAGDGLAQLAEPLDANEVHGWHGDGESRTNRDRRSGGGGEADESADPKRVPLLGTPKTPSWLREWVRRGWRRK